MLYINTKNLSLFTSTNYIKANDNEMYANGGFSGAVGTYIFPNIIEKEIWVSAEIYKMNGYTPTIGVYAKFSNGQSARVIIDNKTLELPYIQSGSMGRYAGSVDDSLIPPGKYCRIRFHVWVSKDDNCKINVEAFIGERNITNGSFWAKSDKSIMGFTSFVIGGSTQTASNMFFKNIVVSDKRISPAIKITELPISSVSGWVANEDNSFTATEFDTEGTLVPDAINLAKLKDYDIQGSVLMGVYTRQGENIKNLHIKTSEQEVDLPLDVGTVNGFAQDLKTTNIDTLSTITISPKG